MDNNQIGFGSLVNQTSISGDFNIFKFTLQDDKSIDIENLLGKSTQTNGLPATSIVGIGGCGTKIAVRAAQMVSEAKNAFINSGDSKKSEKIIKIAAQGISSILPQFIKKNKELFLEPVVIVADFNDEINSASYENIYAKMAILNLKDVRFDGSGNLPIISQYFSSMLLSAKPSNVQDQKWRDARKYLIDSVGTSFNESRMFFYIFSTGGGTGNGASPNFGFFQQFAYNQNISEKKWQLVKNEGKLASSVIFTTGVAILPEQKNVIDSKESTDGSTAKSMQINSGRFMVRYLSSEWRNLKSKDNEDLTNINLKYWNSMFLFSNNLGISIEGKTDANVINDINNFVARQIFNLTTSQANFKEFRDSNLSLKDFNFENTISLDPADLSTALSGPAAIAYADMDQMPEDDGYVEIIQKAFGSPSLNNSTGNINGISLLPNNVDSYKKILAEWKNDNYVLSSSIPFFTGVDSVIVVFSIPITSGIPSKFRESLMSRIQKIFPNVLKIPVAVVPGSTKNFGVTIYFTGGPCLATEITTNIIQYIEECFSRTEDDKDYIYESIPSYIAESDDSKSLDLLYSFKDKIGEHEDISKQMSKNKSWDELKLITEKQGKSTCVNLNIDMQGNLPEINPFLIDSEKIIEALKYMRRVYHYKRKRRQPVNLNKI